MRLRRLTEQFDREPIFSCGPRRNGGGAIGQAVCIGALFALRSATASAEKERCIESFSRAQEQQNAGQVMRAREQLAVCVAEPDCPSVVQDDCRSLLNQVSRSIPSVSLGAQDARGQNISDVRVAIDGQPLLPLQAEATEVDPGEHRFHFERANGAIVEVIRQIAPGDLGLRIVATFPEPAAPPPPRLDQSARLTSPSRHHVVAYALAGTGGLALGSFGYFAITGRREQSRLANECSPACDPGKVDDVRRSYLAADISLGVAVTAIAVSAYLLLTEPSPSPASASWLRNVSSGEWAVAF